jgi:hypothetical protein
VLSLYLRSLLSLSTDIDWKNAPISTWAFYIDAEYLLRGSKVLDRARDSSLRTFPQPQIEMGPTFRE